MYHSVKEFVVTRPPQIAEGAPKDGCMHPLLSGADLGS